MTSYKLFKMSEIFDFKKGKRLTKADMIEGNINYIGAISDNNGVRQKIDSPALFKGNCITVNYNGSVGEAFYQRNNFWASDDVNVLFLKNNELTENIALYLITIIKSNRFKFSYGRKWTLDKMKETEISLPVDKNNKPDWEYMQNYIHSLKSFENIYSNCAKVKITNCKIDFSVWKKFTIDEIFDISIAKSEDIGSLENGEIPFVGRTSSNNGYQGRVESSTITKGQCITVSMVGSFKAFWQPSDFTSSQNILCLRNDKLNMLSSLFLCTLLNKIVERKFSYNKPIQKGAFSKEMILLPTNTKGFVDWKYMEDYILNLKYSNLLK